MNDPPPVRRRRAAQKPIEEPARKTSGAGASGAGKERLLLLDGHSLAYRAFFALPVENFSTTTGQPTNAVYGFTAMLINVLRDETPTHLAVAWDRAAPDLPPRGFRRLQGQPVRDAVGLPEPAFTDPRGV